jgi:hypothetical protein
MKVQGALQQFVELCVSMISVVHESLACSRDSVLTTCKDGVHIRKITICRGQAIQNSIVY